MNSMKRVTENRERQRPVPLVYKNVKLDCGYRLDLVVEGSVVVEVKSVTDAICYPRGTITLILSLLVAKWGY